MGNTSCGIKGRLALHRGSWGWPGSIASSHSNEPLHPTHRTWADSFSSRTRPPRPACTDLITRTSAEDDWRRECTAALMRADPSAEAGVRACCTTSQGTAPPCKLGAATQHSPSQPASQARVLPDRQESDRQQRQQQRRWLTRQDLLLALGGHSGRRGRGGGERLQPHLRTTQARGKRTGSSARQGEAAAVQGGGAADPQRVGCPSSGQAQAVAARAAHGWLHVIHDSAAPGLTRCRCRSCTKPRNSLRTVGGAGGGRSGVAGWKREQGAKEAKQAHPARTR